ncbi:hypothetical protein [Leucobacter soli]|uniref:hypothetical protein n=1 Tax=Leucobacter soli TaxID=2812850 RepID=UPI00360ADF7E
MIPLLDIVGLGLFRFGTGAGQSLFGALVLLPIVWLATAPACAISSPACCSAPR